MGVFAKAGISSLGGTLVPREPLEVLTEEILRLISIHNRVKSKVTMPPQRALRFLCRQPAI